MVARRPVPRGPLVPHQRVRDPAAAAARAPGRHRRARRALRRARRPPLRLHGARTSPPPTSRCSQALRLARQRARARRRDRARRDPRRGPRLDIARALGVRRDDAAGRRGDRFPSLDEAMRAPHRARAPAVPRPDRGRARRRAAARACTRTRCARACTSSACGGSSSASAPVTGREQRRSSRSNSAAENGFARKLEPRRSVGISPKPDR